MRGCGASPHRADRPAVASARQVSELAAISPIPASSSSMACALLCDVGRAPSARGGSRRSDHRDAKTSRARKEKGNGRHAAADDRDGGGEGAGGPRRGSPGGGGGSNRNVLGS